MTNQYPPSEEFRSRINSVSSISTTSSSGGSASASGTHQSHSSNSNSNSNSNFTSPSSIYHPTFSPSTSLNDSKNNKHFNFPSFPHELIAASSSSASGSESNQFQNSSAIPSSSSSPSLPCLLASSDRKNGKAAVKRPRQVLSCVPCKSRKIRCDRGVPRCDSCVRRGIAHECRWGDERDELLKESNPGPTNSALLAKNAQLQSQIQKLESQLASSLDGGFQSSSSVDYQDSKVQALEARIRELEAGSSSLHPEFAKSSSTAKRKNSEPQKEEVEDKVVNEIAEQMGSFWWDLAKNESESLVSSPSPSKSRSDSTGATPPSASSSYRTRMVRELTAALPGPRNLDWIVDFHFREIEPMDRSIHEPTFRSSLLKFKLWISPNDPHEDLPDLPFTALVFALCSDVGSVLSREEVSLLGILPPEYRGDISILLERWHSASWAILCMSQFLSSPTMEGFQTTIRMKGFAQRMGRWPFYINLASAALRASEVLGWGQLGTATDDEMKWIQDRENEIRGIPVQKRGYSYGSHLMREQARKIYWNLRNFEHFLQYRVGFALHVPFATPTATGFPVEVEDDELVEGRALPHSSSVQTTWSWLPYTSKVASFAHRIWEASQPHFNYQNIMSVDAEIRNLSDSIPASFKMDPTSNSSKEDEPWRLSQKVALSLWLNSSLLQLHRRYYASGYQRAEHAFSTSACLSSARQIIQLLQAKVGKPTKEAVGVRWSRFWLPDRIFSAASVLLIQLLQHSVSGDEAESLMKDVDRSIDFIQSFVDSEGFVLKSSRMCAVLRSLRLAVIQHRSKNIITSQDLTTFQLPVRPLKNSYQSSFTSSDYKNNSTLHYPVHSAELNNQPMNYLPFGSDHNPRQIQDQIQNQNQNQNQNRSSSSSSSSSSKLDYQSNASSNQNSNLSIQNQQQNQFRPSITSAETDHFDQQDRYLTSQEQQRIQREIDGFIKNLSPHHSNPNSNLANGVPLFPILDELLMAPPPPPPSQSQSRKFPPR